ncbi:hypothetical protein QBC41DRAFT_21299 [Cercophora samala]|uniref:Flavin reductase like domain-containing protein n=1 Tax=Cercophora samala TaxID=330535 RepID=A0AA40D5N9_9PEZI|nr:hypothetical protein QBC41DRAFT_21299 [Cercophora samala]
MPPRSASRLLNASSRRGLFFHQPGVTSSPPLSPIADRHHQQLPNRLSLARLALQASCLSTHSSLGIFQPFGLPAAIDMPKRKTTASKSGGAATTTRQSKRNKTTTTTDPQPTPSPTMPPIPKAKEIFTPLPPSKTNRLLEPGPILLVSTGSVPDGTHNLMTLGFHSMISHSSPTLVGITLGPWDHSYSLLQKTKECVLCVPNVRMAEKVVDIGNLSAADLSDGETKWGRFGVEVVEGERVRAGLVGGEGVIGNLECEVEDERLVGGYHFWVVRVVKGWVSRENFRLDGEGVGGEEGDGDGDGGRMMHHRGDGSFFVGGREGVLDLRGRMTKWRMLQD